MPHSRPILGICSCISLAVLSFTTPLFGQFVYVANAGGNVSAYTINASTGALMPILGSPFGAGDVPVSVAVDPTGRFAYVANFFSDNVSGYTINATTGALTPIPGSPFPSGLGPFSVAVDPTGKFAYVANLAVSNVSGYTINATTGALTPIPGSPFPTGVVPESVAVDPTGKFAYVANLENLFHHGDISAYMINAPSGALTPVPGSPFPAGVLPSSVAVDPTSTFAYVANGTSDDVSGYTINAITGALTPIPGSPFPDRFFPTSVTTTPLLTVHIDIKPGEDPPTINPKSHGKIAVAILSSPTFDAPAQVATTSLTFGRTGASKVSHFAIQTERTATAMGWLT